MAREHNDHEQQLCELIKPLRAARWTTDIQWADLERRLEKLGQDYGGLELVPDFQRGHVWTQRQQVHYIENCLRGVVPASSLLIQFNCPEFSDDGSDSDLPDGLQCVDGLQRYTAVTEFVQGRIKPFGLTVQEYVGTQFSAKRMFIKVAIHGYTRRTVTPRSSVCANFLQRRGCNVDWPARSQPRDYEHNRMAFGMTDNWELALIAAIEREVGQLEWLVQCEQLDKEGIEAGDVLAQISRIGGLTDLVYCEDMPLSETTRAKLMQQGEKVMNLARCRASGKE